MTYTGRTAERLHRGSKLCAGCNQRVMVGDPRPSSSWPGQLYLSKAQCDLLLVAAAEFKELTSECRRCFHAAHPTGSCFVPVGSSYCGCALYEPNAVPDPVDFVDWISPDALRPPGHHDQPEADGAPPRYDGGAVAQSNARNAHRHPFPLAQVEWRPSRREG